jgi:hypothetical protein
VIFAKSKSTTRKSYVISYVGPSGEMYVGTYGYVFDTNSATVKPMQAAKI